MNTTTPLSEITKDEAADNIELFARERRLVQGEFHGNGDDGRRLACLLGSIDQRIGSSDACPAQIMPNWMAELIVALFDGIGSESIFTFGAKFGDALRRGDTGHDVRRRFLVTTIAIVVEDADSVGEAPTYWPAIKAACLNVGALLRDGAGQNDLQEAADAVRVANAVGYTYGGEYISSAIADAAEVAYRLATFGNSAYSAWEATTADRGSVLRCERLFDALIAEMLRTS